jgi:hypothetical protein
LQASNASILPGFPGPPARTPDGAAPLWRRRA